MPLQAPIARDDRVTSAQTLGKTAVDVPVLKNDEDPDGVGENLKIATDATTARPGTEGNMIVELTEQPQLIPYTVEDVDGQKSTAIIWVPGLGQQVPTLAKDEVIEARRRAVRHRGPQGMGQGPRGTLAAPHPDGPDQADRRRRRRSRGRTTAPP